MTDIFISYSRTDIDVARILSESLENLGYTVWWDRVIPAGSTFDEVIEDALEKSSCVIVLWSSHSVESRWVRLEAQEGIEREILIPVLIEDVRIPLAFRNIQAVKLSGWAGDTESQGFQDLLRDVGNVLGSEKEPLEKVDKKTVQSTKWWWVLSIGVSIILALYLLICLSKMNAYHIFGDHLGNWQDVDNWLEYNAKEFEDTAPSFRVRTGIFIQSLKLVDFRDVTIAGQIWQKYPLNMEDSVIPARGEVGFTFPNQVNYSESSNPQEVFRNVDERFLTIRWSFEVTLRQQFDQSRYPFDHKTVTVRIQPSQLSGNIVLVPDFDSYEDTGHLSVFGMDYILLDGYQRENTFFSYRSEEYGTNFGQSDFERSDYPEFTYNFVIKRKFENIFILHLFPLLMIYSVLFAALLAISGRDKLSKNIKLSFTGFLGVSTVLTFIVILLHIQSRKQIEGNSFVYLDYYYMLMYAMLVATTVNAYMYSAGVFGLGKFIHYKDNLFPKISYWPVIIGSLIRFTL